MPQLDERSTYNKEARGSLLIARDEVISSLHEQIQNKEIWIHYDEVKKYAFSKNSKIVKSFKKQIPNMGAEIESDEIKLVVIQYSNGQLMRLFLFKALF